MPMGGNLKTSPSPDKDILKFKVAIYFKVKMR